jgi:hypothetical protein
MFREFPQYPLAFASSASQIAAVKVDRYNVGLAVDIMKWTTPGIFQWLRVRSKRKILYWSLKDRHEWPERERRRFLETYLLVDQGKPIGMFALTARLINGPATNVAEFNLLPEFRRPSIWRESLSVIEDVATEKPQFSLLRLIEKYKDCNPELLDACRQNGFHIIHSSLGDIPHVVRMEKEIIRSPQFPRLAA